MTPEELKALIAEAREWDSQIAQSAPTTTARLIELLADALEAVYDAGRRELAERFATQDATRKAAIEELIAWEDENETAPEDQLALSAHSAEETEELLAYKPITADELDSYLRGSRPAEQELSVLVPVHVVARAVAALRATHPAEETGWEIKWAPVLRDGSEWAIRDEAECDALIEEYADPAHWIYEDYNDDLEPVVGKRAYRRRKAGPWSPVPTDGGAT